MNIVQTFFPFLNFSWPTEKADQVSAVINLIQSALILLFVVVIIAAIVYAAIAGLTYIRSQGDADKVEEAQKAVKAVLFGVGAVFVGIIGVIIITSIFSDSSNLPVRPALQCFLGDTNACASANGGAQLPACPVPAVAGLIRGKDCI